MAQHPTSQEIYVTSRSSRSIAVLSLEPAGWRETHLVVPAEFKYGVL